MTTQIYPQKTWWQRIIQRTSHRLCKQFFLLFTGFIVLVFGILMAAFSLDLRMFSLAMTMVATAAVFLLLVGVVTLEEGRQKSEEFKAPQVEESWRYRIEHIEI